MHLAIDGASRGNPGPSGVGVVVTDSQGRPVKKISLYLGLATNNVAESVALIVALQEALQRGARQVEVRTDSQLLSRQVLGDYRVKDQVLGWLHVIIRNLIGGFQGFNILHVPRTQNRLADRLAGQAITEAIRQGTAPKKRAAPPAAGSLLQSTFWA